MANYKKLRLYYDRWNDRVLDARGMPIKHLDLMRNDIYQVELQVFDGGQFVVDSAGLIPGNIAVDLTEFTNIVIGLKSQAHYLADGSFDLALAGYDTNNPIHSLVNGRAAMLALFAAPSGDYYMEVELRTTLGNSLTVTNRPMMSTLHRDVIVGTEPNMPSGVSTAISGSASIEDNATDTGNISLSGMTANGQVIVGMLAPTGSPTEPTWWVEYGTDFFIIKTSAAPGIGNAYNFQWTLVRKTL